MCMWVGEWAVGWVGWSWEGGGGGEGYGTVEVEMIKGDRRIMGDKNGFYDLCWWFQNRCNIK